MNDEKLREAAQAYIDEMEDRHFIVGKGPLYKALRDALKPEPDWDKAKFMECPKCSNELKRVRQPDISPLNKYQWEAGIAGNWYCDFCKGSRGNSGYRYYWDNELEKQSS